jgi:hypothetical protein
MVSILRHPDFSEHHAVDDLLGHSEDVLNAFLHHPKTSQSTLAWAHGVIKLKYVQLIRDLADKDNGWHFSAANTSAEQLQNFRIEGMAVRMQALAPELWDMLGLLLSAHRQSDVKDDPMDVDWAVDSPTRRAQKPAERREALIAIVRVD